MFNYGHLSLYTVGIKPKCSPCTAYLMYYQGTDCFVLVNCAKINILFSQIMTIRTTQLVSSKQSLQRLQCELVALKDGFKINSFKLTDNELQLTFILD